MACGDVEGTAARPAQAQQVAAAAEPLAQIAGERADVEPRAGGHPKLDLAAVAAGNVEGLHRDRYGAQFHRRRAARQVVRLVAAETFRGVYRRLLVERAAEVVRGALDVVVGRRRLRRRPQRLTIGVVGVGRPRRAGSWLRRLCLHPTAATPAASPCRTPAAAGRWPADRACRYARCCVRGSVPRSRATTSCDVGPAGLSIRRTPSMGNLAIW